MTRATGTLRQIARNLLAKTTAEVLTRLLSVLFFMVVARTLAPEGFGKFTFAYALVTLFGAALDLGLHPLFIREVARDPGRAPHQWAVALTFKAGLAGPIVLALLTLPLLTGRAWDTTWAVYLLTAYVLLQSLVELVVAVFTAFGRLEYELALRLAGKVALIGLGGLALWAGWHLLGLTLAYVAAAAVTLALGLRLARRFGTFTWGWAGAEAWRLGATIWPVAVAFLLAFAARRVAPLAVALLRGETEAGFFGAAARILEALDLVPAAFAAALFPVLASSDPAGERFRRALAQSVRGLLIVSLPLAMVLHSGAGPLVTLFYGTAYLPAVPALQLLGWSMPFGFLTVFFLFVFLALDRPRLLLGLTAAGLGVSLLLTPALVARWGAAGGGLGVLLTEGVLALLCVLALGALVRPAFAVSWGAVKPFLAGLAAVGALGLVNPLPWTARVSLALAVYGACLVALRIFSREEWGLLREVLFVHGGRS